MSSGSVGAQDWRAVACLAPSGERLLCVGESSSQVRAAYTGAWGEVIRDEDRPTVRAISLQRWAGQFWSGQWEHQMYLAVPTARGGKASPSEAGEASRRKSVDEDEAEAESIRMTSRHQRLPRRKRNDEAGVSAPGSEWSDSSLMVRRHRPRLTGSGPVRLGWARRSRSGKPGRSFRRALRCPAVRLRSARP